MSCYQPEDRTLPRMLRGRHGEECPARLAESGPESTRGANPRANATDVIPGAQNGAQCPGCQPCPDAHCRTCNKVHDQTVCGGCRFDIRDDLAEIARMCGEPLLAKVLADGRVDTEAANILGPVADHEARGHLEASVAAGRVPADWLEVADDEDHPLLVLASWQDVYADAFGVDLTERATIAGAAGWLDLMLGRICAEEWVPVEDFAHALRASRSRVERVLSDGEQVERGAPCLACRSRNLVLTYGDAFAHDRWTCPRRDCGATYTRAQYRGMVERDARDRAEWLPVEDMVARTGIKAWTIRKWSQRGYVRQRMDSGRVVFSVNDVEARRASVSNEARTTAPS